MFRWMDYWWTIKSNHWVSAIRKPWKQITQNMSKIEIYLFQVVYSYKNIIFILNHRYYAQEYYWQHDKGIKIITVTGFFLKFSWWKISNESVYNWITMRPNM